MVAFIALRLFPASAVWLLALALLARDGMASPQETQPQDQPDKIRVLIVDGQNNHPIWPKTTEMMRNYLLASGRFSVDIARTQPKGADATFAPDFSQYHVVLSNYNGEAWPEKTEQAFENFVSSGGGFVVIHAANNAFPNWREYNRMIGLGGWGGRNEESGPYVYFDQQAKLVRDSARGQGGSHGPQHEFLIEIRDDEHPITQGMPLRWLHTQDELYDRLRGPGENLHVLATAFAAPEQGGTGRHEPMVMVVEYGKGRVFHTTLGHADYSQECTGFITLLLRGTEWAATGQVTIPIPDDFPTDKATSRRTAQAPRTIEPIRLGNTVNPSKFQHTIFAGAIAANDAAVIRQQGVRTIISLCQPNETDWDEAAWAAKEGFDFHQIPCGPPSSISKEQLDRVFALLSQAGPDHAVLIHCAQGGRVGACWAFYRNWTQGISTEDALREAAEIGLRSEAMQKAIREKLEAGNK